MFIRVLQHYIIPKSFIKVCYLVLSFYRIYIYVYIFYSTDVYSLCTLVLKKSIYDIYLSMRFFIAYILYMQTACFSSKKLHLLCFFYYTSFRFVCVLSINLINILLLLVLKFNMYQCVLVYYIILKQLIKNLHIS